MTLLLALPLLCAAALLWTLHRGGSRRGLVADLAALAALALLLWPQPTASPEPAGDSRPTLALVVDVSSSMAAADAAPNRLEQARRELRTLIGALPGARFALLPFAGEAVLQLPVTADRQALLFFIDRLTPGLVAAPGSAPEEALRQAAQALAGIDGDRAIILFSDGERTRPERPPQFDPHLPVYVVPCGSTAGAVLLDRHGLPRRDENGLPVISRCERERLAALASGGGTLLEAVGGNPAVLPLLQRWQRPQAAADNTFPWLPAAAFLLLLLRHLPRPAAPWRRGAAGAGVLLLCVACHASAPDSGTELFLQAARLAASGDPLQQEEAIELFTAAARRLDGSERGAALFNRGTLLLAAGQPEPALTSLEQALLLCPGDEGVRRNFILALRALGPARTPGVGEGESSGGEGAGAGATLDRSQALQLLESIRPEAAALSASDRTVHEQHPARDW